MLNSVHLRDFFLITSQNKVIKYFGLNSDRVKDRSQDCTDEWWALKEYCEVLNLPKHVQVLQVPQSTCCCKECWALLELNFQEEIEQDKFSILHFVYCGNKTTISVVYSKNFTFYRFYTFDVYPKWPVDSYQIYIIICT